MKLIGAIVFILGVSQAIALCTDLSGTWRSQINSKMIIESITGDVFTGTFHMEGDSSEGPAVVSTKILGLIKTVENGTLVGFNTLLNKGANLRAWVGECIVCDGKETIFTTWESSNYKVPLERWTTNRIHQDTFLRSESAAEEVPLSSERDSSVSPPELQGEWKSNWGETLDITEVQEQGTFKGTLNVVGEDGVLAVGSFDGNQTYTGVAFTAATSNEIRGCSGHIDDPESKVYEASWVQHTLQRNCEDPRKLVNFGIDNYNKS